MSGSDAITVRHLNFRFGENLTLSDISLSFTKGKFYTVLGPNGSGKTTLLRHIAKAFPLPAETIWIGEADLKTIPIPALARQVAVVPQETTVPFDFSVFEIVMMGRNPYIPQFGMESDTDRSVVREALEMTDTWKLRARKINTLSGGERQRVLVARALAQQTGIILLDEPVSHLDLRYQIELLQDIRNLNQTRETTIVMVLHDLNLAAAFADRLILMQEGRVHSEGPPEALLRPDTIREVYGVNVRVMRMEDTGKPYVMLKI